MIRLARVSRLCGETQTITGPPGGLDHGARKISVRISDSVRLHTRALFQQSPRTDQFVFKPRAVAPRQRIVIETVRADLDQSIVAGMAVMTVMAVAARFDDIFPTHQCVDTFGVWSGVLILHFPR